MREIASVCKYSTAVASSLTKRPSEVFSRWKVRDEGGEAAGFLLQIADQFQVIHPLLQGFAAANIMVAVVRMRADGGAVYVDPILHPALEAADPLTDGIVQDFGAAAGDGIEAGIHQAAYGVTQAETADLGDVVTSGAERQCKWMRKRCLMPRNRSSYHSILRSGCNPPCMRTPVPPRSMVS